MSELPKVDANEALTKLGKCRAHIARVSSGASIAEPLPGKQGSHAGRGTQVRADAETLGFTEVGHYWYFTLDFRRRPRESWIDDSRVVRLSLRRTPGVDVIERAMSRYFLETMFDDGSVIVTWAKAAPAFPDCARAIERDGTGDLTADYASHKQAVIEHAAAGRRALALSDLASTIRCGTWYGSRLRDVAPRLYFQRNVALFVVLIALLSYLAWRF